MGERSERTTRVSRASKELHLALRDAREQSAASREILAALGRAGAKPGEILDTILEHAAHLCRAQASQLYLLKGDVFRLSRVSGEIPTEYRKLLLDQPLARNRSSIVGRAAEEMRTIQIPDVLKDADYGRHDLQRLAGYRTLLSTPMILQNEVVGVLTMWRTDVDPFNTRECELLEEFAVQGAIVMRQDALRRALETRGKELASKVAQLEALREVGYAVGSTLDLDEVLDQIVSNAVRLTGTDGGSIMEYDESTDSFHVRAAAGSSPDLLKQLRAITIDRNSTLVGRAATAHRTLEVQDLVDTDLDPHLDALFRDGWRSVLAVPILRGERILGVLVIRRREHGLVRTTCRTARDVRRAVGAGHSQRAPVRGAADKDQRARDRQPPQIRVPGQHVARTADPAQRGDRLLGGAAGSHVRGDQRAPGRVPARHLELRPPPTRATQRDTRPVEGRSGPDGARAKHIQRQQRLRVLPDHGPRAGDFTRHHRHRRRRRRGRDDRGRRAALQAGGGQPALQRRQVHARRRQRVRPRLPRGDRPHGHGDRHRHRGARSKTRNGSSSPSSRAAAAHQRRRAPVLA